MDCPYLIQLMVAPQSNVMIPEHIEDAVAQSAGTWLGDPRGCQFTSWAMPQCPLSNAPNPYLLLAPHTWQPPCSDASSLMHVYRSCFCLFFFFFFFLCMHIYSKYSKLKSNQEGALYKPTKNVTVWYAVSTMQTWKSLKPIHFSSYLFHVRVPNPPAVVHSDSVSHLFHADSAHTNTLNINRNILDSSHLDNTC